MDKYGKLSLVFVIFVWAFKLSSQCSEGYFSNEGGKCLECPKHCLVCRSNEYCSDCEGGFWGRICDSPCSKCKYGTSCEKENGFCLDDCRDGFAGILCDVKCDDKCSACSRTNAKFCLKCAYGRYPDTHCDRVCPTACANRTCNETDICISGCVSGYWGSTCEKECPEHCWNTSCTRENGICAYGFDSGRGTYCHNDHTDGIDRKNIIIAVLSVTVFILAVVIIIMCIRYTKKRRYSGNRNQGSAAADLRGLERSEETQTPLVNSMPDRKLDDNGTADFSILSEAHTRQPLWSHTEPSLNWGRTQEEKLQEFVDRMKAKQNEDIKDEFCMLPIAVQKSHSKSLERENQTEQEKEGVFPYDENIVTVHGKNGEELYVNASFIKDKGGHAYIASRGPRKCDGPRRMWKLLWENDCTTVVMLNSFEKGEKKKKYWPSMKETQSYEKMSVSRRRRYKHKQSENEDCNIRVFKLEKGEEIKFVKQLQYTGWPEKEVPDMHKMFSFISKVRCAHVEGSGPIVVHGRRGVGRTGTFIALDLLMKEVDDLLNSDEDKTIDVFNCVRNLRIQRTLMVENCKQYKFLYDALQQYAENLLQQYRTTTVV